MKKSGPFIMSLHRGFIKCPNCGTGHGFPHEVIGEESINCPTCGCVFSYDDGFIENIIDIVRSSKIGVRSLFSFPICAGIIEIDTVGIKIGENKKVSFNHPFYKVYDVKLGKSGRRIFYEGELTVDDSTFIPYALTEKGFSVSSSTLKSSDVQKEVEITYFAQGRDSRVEKIPIWHRFLQNVIDLIRKKEYGMAIVQSIATFDAFYDGFLFKQLRNKRGYPADDIKRILETKNRREKLYYCLYIMSLAKHSKIALMMRSCMM